MFVGRFGYPEVSIGPMIPPFHVKTPLKALPYRSLVPVRMDNLLVAGRCYSSDLVANDLLAPIQFCIAMGQAAGTAAALAIKHGIPLGNLDYKLLQDSLAKQGVPLPGSSVKSLF